MKFRSIVILVLFAVIIPLLSGKVLAFNWSQVTISGETPEERFMHAMFFDKKTEKIYLTGGMQYPFSPIMSDVWSFDPKTNKWEKIKPTGFITEKYSTRDYVYIPSERAIYVWADNAEEKISKMFIYDIEKKEWSKVTPIGETPTIAGQRTINYDPMNNRILLFGGYFWSPEKAGVLNDLYSYDLKSKEWTRLKTKGVEAPRLKNALSFLDVANSRIIIFGGMTSTETPNTDLFSFNYSTNTWEKIETQGDAPPGGEKNYGTFDEKGKRLIVIGKTKDPKDQTNSLYTFDLTSKKWENVPLKGQAIRQFFECGPVFCPTNNKLYVYGGIAEVPYKSMFTLDISSEKK
jgi:N-acetylneuraminic acid mutarotase